MAFFSNEHHFEIWFPKKRTITFFWSKLSKLHKKDPILHVTTTFSLKQGETRTSYGPIPHPLRWHMWFLITSLVSCIMYVHKRWVFTWAYLLKECIRVGLYITTWQLLVIFTMKQTFFIYMRGFCLFWRFFTLSGSLNHPIWVRMHIYYIVWYYHCLLLRCDSGSIWLLHVHM